MNPRIFQFALIGTLLLAFVLLVLASLSVPIIKSISFLQATSDKTTFTSTCIWIWTSRFSDKDANNAHQSVSTAHASLLLMAATVQTLELVSVLVCYLSWLHRGAPLTRMDFTESFDAVPGDGATKKILSGSLPYGLVFHPIGAKVPKNNHLMADP